MRKIKVLAITEASYLDSGYAVYWRHILRELDKREDYEVAEFATFVDPQYNKVDQIPWKVYPNIPTGMDLNQFKEWSKNPMHNFGAYLFNEIALDFQPDVVLHAGDFWMQKYVNDSPYRHCFKYIWLAPCDSSPQNIEWLEDMARCDGVLSYCDWGKETIEKESKVKVFGAAPASCQEFFMPMSKSAIKEHFGIRPEVRFIGTVMRNQPRKLFPQLFHAYRTFLDKYKRSDIYLYCHTSYPDSAWKIPELLQEYGVGDRTFFTYACKKCGFAFPSLYSDIATCKNCGGLSAMMPNTMFGVSPEQLSYVYNVFDMYVQYSNSEGFGLPMVEAAACGVPVMATDYSAMSDVVRKLGGTPIKVKAMTKEISTGCERAIPDEDDFIEQLEGFFKKPEMIRRTYGLKARAAFSKHYNWDVSGKVWSDLIDTLCVEDNKWMSPPRILEPQTQIDEDKKLPNNEYARWLLLKVSRQPHKLGSYLEMQLTRDLNYGCTTGVYTTEVNQSDGTLFNELKTEPFNRQDAYEQFKKIGEHRRILEIVRGQKLGLL